MSDQNQPINLLLDAAQSLIAEGMGRIRLESPEEHAAIIEFAQAGAIPRMTIETHPTMTTVSLTLNRDGGGVHVFKFCLERAQSLLH